VEGIFIAVTDKNSNYAADKTDSAGQITIPGTSGQTNSDGNVTVGWQDADGNRWTLTVKVEDYETGRPIEGADVSIGSTGNITVKLPDGTDMDENNRVTVTVTDNQKKPQEGVTVIVNGDLNQTATGKTDEDGKLIVPLLPSRRSTAPISWATRTAPLARSGTWPAVRPLPSLPACWRRKTATPSPPLPPPSTATFPPTHGTPAT
jgi:5-hydroxyisourate hydrolase-like protein (transthyretin family)